MTVQRPKVCPVRSMLSAISIRIPHCDWGGEPEIRYPNGQPVRVSTTVRDLDGTLVTPSALTLAVQAPDGTQKTYSAPAEDSAGLYHQDIPASDLTSNGHYQYAWTATGTGAGVAAGDFDVYDPFEIRVLSLQDAKDMLNIPQSTTSSDAEIDAWIASIESGLERFTGGPVINTAITERVEATDGYTVLCVRQRPLVSLTSVVNVGSGVPLGLTDMTDLDPNAGTIRRRLGWPFFGPFYQYLPIFTVTYVAGWGTAVPAAFNAFARIVIQHMWTTQRGPVAMPMAGEPAVAVPGFGFAIPARAAELLNGSQGGIPFACEAYV